MLRKKNIGLKNVCIQKRKFGFKKKVCLQFLKLSKTIFRIKFIDTQKLISKNSTIFSYLCHFSAILYIF